jgi:CBS domain-containing protein
MLLQEILSQKGAAVHTIHPDATLDDLVQSLVQHRCGSLIVTDSDSSAPMLGIITERDVLRACAARRTTLDKIRVCEFMTREVAVRSPADSVEDTMGLMTEMRIRHLPIIDDGRLVGIISIGDIVKAQHNLLTMENHYLKSYIHGEEDSVLMSVKPR